MPRLEGRVCVEEREQLIVQDLDLAHRRMAGMDADRRIGEPGSFGEREGAARAGRERIDQVQYVGLQRLEHGRLRSFRRRVDEELVPLDVADVLEKVLELPSELAERNDQRMSALEVCRRRGAETELQLPARLKSAIALARDDLAHELARRRQQK